MMQCWMDFTWTGLGVDRTSIQYRGREGRIEEGSIGNLERKRESIGREGRRIEERRRKGREWRTGRLI